MVNLNNPRDLFASGGSQLGLTLTPLQLDQLTLHLSELLRWNKKINLTGLRKEREIITNLFLDSLTPLLFLDPNKNTDWIDIGTGAGFPGLVLKIAAPQVEMTLVEPTRKKVAFLHHLIGLLGLSGITALNARIEDLHGLGKKYDLLLTRALSPKVILENGGSLVRAGGKHLFFQGSSDETSWKKLLRDYPQIELDRINPVRLPFRNVSRSIALLRNKPQG